MRSSNFLLRTPITLGLGSLLLLASCAASKRSSNTSDGRLGVRMSGGAATTDGAPGTRYITTLGLPSDMVINYPDWIVNPAIDGVLGSVGVSGRSALGTREQVEEARLAARLELARMLETRVQSIGRGELEEHRAANGSIEDPDLEGQARRSKLGIDRDITDLVLSGSRQRALWFDPLSHDCYVWIVMDGAIPGKTNHTLENGISIYVANTPIGTEYRPQQQPTPKAKAAPPTPAPVAPTDPIERLEENLKPIETVPVRPQP